MEKVCVNHPESPSVGSCKACEKPVCLMCITEVQGVSFCSDACGAAYQEVKDWLERPAAEEEWNPLAEAKAKAAPAPRASAPPPPVNVPMAAETTGERMANAFDTVLPTPPAPPPPAGPNRTPLYIAIAATVLVVIGAFFLFSGNNDSEKEIAKVDPPKQVDPPKPVEPPKPVVKVEPPPPPPPVKVDPPKPVEPPKPPIKIEPPPPVKVEPPKPVVKIEPPPPVKVEPPKPVVVAPPPPVKVEPPKPVEPPPAPHLAFIRDPWGKEKTGAWYRVKSSSGGKDSYKDIGLRESGAGYRVVVSQASAEGKTEPEQFTWTEPEEISVFGSVNGDVKGNKYAADVVRTKAAKPSQFVFKDGPHAGAYFPSEAVLARLDKENVKVKDREFACTVMETEPKDGKKASTTWFSTQVPLAIVKWEGDGATSAIVDFGDDWEKRPPFPAATAPIAKVDPPPPAKVVPPPPVVVVPPPPGVVPPPPGVVPPPPAKVVPPPPGVVPPPPPAVVPPPPGVVPPPPPAKIEPAKVVPPPPPPVVPPPVVPPPPPPAKVEPPKPPPPPPPPPPAKTEPAKVEPAKVEPAKVEPAKLEPAKVDTSKQEAEARAKKSMADASALIKEASPMYGEVSGAMDALPTDKAQLRDLYRKAERVQLKLSDARILYSSVRSDAPDPSVIDRRVKALDEALEGVGDALKTLRSRID